MIQSVTELVQRLFNAYDCNFKGLDWEDKINEYTDVINDLISYDTDLDDLYKTIRQEYPYRKLPLPHDIKKFLTKKERHAEVVKQVEHADNGKLVVIACYKNDNVKEIRDYIVHNTYKTKSVKQTTDDLKNKFDSVKVYEFCKGSSLIGNVVFIPNGYNEQGEVTEYRKMRIG